MTRAAAIAAAAVGLSVLLGAGSPAAAEPTWRYGAAFSFGWAWVDGQRFDELELTVQASRRIAPGWRLAGHLHHLRLSHPDQVEPSGDGHRLGVGLERSLARHVERGGGAATASLRAGVTRETVHWDQGRLDRHGAYVELRGLVDFDLDGRDRRWFGLGLSVRAYMTRTPALLHTGPRPTAASPREGPHHDVGLLIAWEWTGSR